MKQVLIGIGVVSVVVAVFGFSIWLGLYNYHDCLKVGHSNFYCVMHFGK